MHQNVNEPSESDSVRAMADEDLHLPFCTIVAVETTNFCYRVCSNCEKSLPDKVCGSYAAGGIECQHCRLRPPNPGVPGSKRVYRILGKGGGEIEISEVGFHFSEGLQDLLYWQLSVATENRVLVAICFDRAAQVLMGCSADEFFDFASANPFAVEAAGSILEGEMFRMVLRKPKSGNAQNMRVDSILPLASKFQPVMNHLKRLYQAL